MSSENILRDVDRRELLQGIGAAGVGSITFTGTGTATEVDDATHLGQVVFAEVGLSHESQDLEPNSHVDPMTVYEVDADADRLLFHLMPEWGVELFQSSTTVVRGTSFDSAPVTLNENREIASVPLENNDRLQRHALLATASPYRYPPARAERATGDSVEIDAAGESAVVEPGGTGRLRLPGRQVESASGGRGSVTPVYTAQNHGAVDVYVSEVR